MIRQSFTLILVLSVVSSIYSQSNPADSLNHVCETSMKAIKAGTYEKSFKERQECREKAVPKDIFTAVTKCEETLPMSTVDQITKVCSAKEANLAKMTEVIACAEKALGDKYIAKFSDCCKVMDPDNASKRSK